MAEQLSPSPSDPVPATGGAGHAEDSWPAAEPVVRLSGELADDTHLIVLLHGYGADEYDMLGLAPQLAPGTVVAAIRAPEPLPFGGQAWYPLEIGPSGVTDDPAYADGAAAAAQMLIAWVSSQPVGRVSIGGFSQGASIALATMSRAPELAESWLVLSGFAVPDPNEPQASPNDDRPRVFWARGEADQLIPERWIEHTTRWLADRAEVVAHTYPDLGHSIDGRVLGDLNTFLSGPAQQ